MKLHLNYLCQSNFYLLGNISSFPEQLGKKGAIILDGVFHVTQPVFLYFSKGKNNNKIFFKQLLSNFFV